MQEQPPDQEKALEREVEEAARKQRRTAKSTPAGAKPTGVEASRERELDRRKNKGGEFSG